MVTRKAGAADERCKLDDRIARLRRRLRASRRRSRLALVVAVREDVPNGTHVSHVPLKFRGQH